MLFQYEVCPYCCSVKAYLDAHGVAYATTEVNPLNKAEIKASAEIDDALKEKPKIPTAVVDGVSLNESRRIIEEAGSSSASAATGDADAHAARAVDWAHEKLVILFPPNIYRSLGESFEAFRYISASDHFSPAQRLLLRGTGSLFMWAVSGKLKKKYGIEDERGELHAALATWMAEHATVLDDGAADAARAAIAAGGGAGAKGDLLVYGMLSAMEGMATLREALDEGGPAFRAWYDRMRGVVGASARVTGQ